ncbi:MAG: sigma-70 family RNA polymerase sigma factor [Polyangiaceae bacterium]|nr:sigma-70 family RNA polymerase sigma factor [Polyangiaceae bacterium]
MDDFTRNLDNDAARARDEADVRPDGQVHEPAAAGLTGGAPGRAPRGAASAPSPKRPRKPSQSKRAAAEQEPPRDAIEIYLERASRRPLLTREGEIELARRVEVGEHAMLAAVAAAPAGLQELAAMGEELREKQLRAREVLRDGEDGEMDEGARSARLAAALDRAGALANGRRAGAAEAAKARRALVGELERLRLHRRTLDRLVEAVRAAAAEDEAARRALEAAEAGRRAADQAKAELVESNLRLVLLFARRHVNQGLQLLDLVQEGNIGLMRAVDKFDHRRGIRFSTYAAFWVRQQMARAVAEQGKTIRVPVHMVESRQKLARARRRFVHEHGREPDEAELAAWTGLVREKVRAVSALAAEPLSLQAPSGAEGEATIGDFVADRSAAAPDEEIARTRMAVKARELLKTLSPREQEVLRLRFGLDGREELTLQEIGTMLSVSRERVRQIEAEALRKLRGPSRRDELETYLG